MSKIFRSEEVVKIAEAVMIPDCVVRVEPRELPESTLLGVSDDDLPASGDITDGEMESGTETDPSADDEAMSEDAKASYESEYEKLEIERDAIIKQAQSEAAQIIENARAEAAQILEDAAEQAKNVMASAMEDGYAEGVRTKQEEIENCLLELNQSVAELKINQEEYFDDYADELRLTALEVAEKVLAQKLEVDERVIIPLARSAVKTLREVNWIKVEISDKMRNVAAELEKVISDAKPNQRIEVEVRRDAPEGTCVVSTAEGVIVASVLQQLQNIREYFEHYKDSEENVSETRSF
ncbi:FliH/SctL family protein [Ruminococcus sp. HUN007]|uniref:FliH/SctL family protein n=1 Tax=Ruminococcus sp. HUN007 TaxID=1514668 RepID=UPI0005D1DA38|nr:FliH/SctL family protein [Ruminococcus sp. HUN007]